MDKVEILEIESIATGKPVEHAIITHADGSFTSMPKSIYDAQLADEASTK